MTLVAVGWLGVHGNHWWTDLSANLRWLDVSGTTGDFTNANPIRFTMINLQVLLFAIFPTARAANVTAYALSAVLAAAFLFLTRNRNATTELVEASTVAVLSLLPGWQFSSFRVGLCCKGSVPRESFRRQFPVNFGGIPSSWRMKPGRSWDCRWPSCTRGRGRRGEVRLDAPLRRDRDFSQRVEPQREAMRRVASLPARCICLRRYRRESSHLH